MSSEQFDDSPTDDIMCATYRALCKHGYADLTMQDIADEWDKSKAALHYHYDTKHGLLLSFLDYLFAEFEARVADPEGSDPEERLRAFVDAVLSRSRRGAHQEFQTAILELKAQAPYEDEFRERLAEFDRFMRDSIRELVGEGIERGQFREDVDADTAATTIVTLLNGGHTRRVTLGVSAEDIEQSVLEYVETALVAGGDE